jgi:hypothetical protein
MINHARTLLANLSGVDRPPPGTYGEEYIPPAYRPRPADQALGLVRRTLLGADPDGLYLNQRLRLLTLACHSTPSVDAYFRSLDPRLTYLPGEDPIAWGQTVQVVPEYPSTLTLFLAGDARADDLTGISVFGYEVAATAGELVVVDLAGGGRRVQPREDEPPVLSCGLRPVLAGEWNPGSWRALVVAPSRLGLPDLLAGLEAAGASLNELLARVRPRWGELWRDGIGAAARLAGAAAAVVEAAEADGG